MTADARPNQRVLVLYTGGTVGMEPSPEGYRPMPDFAGRLRETLQRSAGDELPELDVVALERPIDSANLSPLHWQRMAEPLLANWDAYTGFVLLHGTDTMAWSASALSFILQGTDKPVIFTGSQIPLLQPRSDAPAHLQAALQLAARHRVPEVGLCFGRHLWRGNRSSKIASQALDAFGSPNYPPLADLAIELQVHTERLLRAPAQQRFIVPAFDPQAVAVLNLYPGISGHVVDALLGCAHVRGLVLRSYGVGNAPEADRSFMQALERASQRGVVLLNTTLCATGPVVQGAYATGSALTQAGVVPGADMTLEAAFAKLHVLLGTETDPDRVRERLGQPLCGELTPAT